MRTGRTGAVAAGGISWAAFAAAHAGAGYPAGHLLQSALAGIVLGAVYVLERLVADLVGVVAYVG